MKRNTLIAVSAIILAVLLLCSGCAAALQVLEDAETRQNTEAMLDALITNDFQAAYSLVSENCPEEDFKSVFTQMQKLLANTDSYELKLLSIHANSEISNGQKSRSISSVYEMTTRSSRIIVSIKMDSQIGLCSFHLTPYENTDYHSIGTLENMENATGVQWALLLLNVITIALTAFAIVDCCRQRIKKKALWLLLLILGFFSIGATISPTNFRFNFNLGWITAYSALIRYGSGTVMLRLMLPVGTIIYFVMRRSLLTKNTPSNTPNEEQAEPYEDGSNKDELSSPTLTDNHP